MSEHDPTDPHVPAGAVPSGVVAGESVPPDEHTMRVRAAREQAARAGQPAANLNVHDKAPEPPPLSSTEMAEVSRKARRRERDRFAERRARRIVILGFLGVGGVAFAGVNYLVEDSPAVPIVLEDIPGEGEAIPQRPGVVASSLDESPDIPAIRSLRNEGLTIAAEGLPRVDALAQDRRATALAALETCRFAYGVWEFSPNKRFRFMTTCEALEGQVMVGAYEIDGSKVRMSPLITSEDVVFSEFEVAKPSRMSSKVSRRQGDPAILVIEQKVTVMRVGMEGDAFRMTYAPKNTIDLGGRRGAARPAPPPRDTARTPTLRKPPGGKANPRSKDPLLDLLKKQ